MKYIVKPQIARLPGYACYCPNPGPCPCNCSWAMKTKHRIKAG
ncbi:MAG: hypothetical protein ABIM19_07965 [candidate division WOR-3 bacterium]